MGLARARLGADVVAFRGQPGCRNSRLPRRGWGDQHYHAFNGLFPACFSLRTALDEEFRARLSDGYDDTVFNLDAHHRDYTGYALDYARLALWPRSSGSNHYSRPLINEGRPETLDWACP